MIITQDDLIREIADREDINVATVRQIFRTAENIVFDYLSSTTPSENTKVKLFKGLNIESSYGHSSPKGILRDVIFKPKILAKAKLTKYYKQKLNDLNE